MTEPTTLLRILVTQSLNWQTSEFIQTISDEIVMSETRYPIELTRINLQIGIIRVEFENTFYEVELLSPPRNLRHDWIYDNLYKVKTCNVVIVNNKIPESFRETYSILETQYIYGLYPCVIALTDYQESQGMWDFRERWQQRNKPCDIPIVNCIASDKKSVANVLIAICEEILREIESEEEDMPE